MSDDPWLGAVAMAYADARRWNASMPPVQPRTPLTDAERKARRRRIKIQAKSRKRNRNR